MPDVATEDSFHAEELARRRWRNMMIAAMANKNFSAEQKKYLEKMRQELGIPLAEAGRMVRSYQEKGGNILLFGNAEQRLELFRDMLSMILVDGKIDRKEQQLLLAVAERVGIPESDLPRHIEECREALAAMDESHQRESSRLSRRVFRRMIQSVDVTERDKYLADFDQTDDKQARRELELEILRRMADDKPQKESSESTRTLRQRRAYLEDQQCAKILIERELVTEEQMRPFRERQEKLFAEHGKVVSFITEMVRAHVLSPKEAATVREKARIDMDINEPTWEMSETTDNSGFTVRWQRVTLDHTFYASLLQLQGFLDNHTCKVFEQALKKVLAMEGDEGNLIILDLRHLSYISSSGIGLILNYRAKELDRWGEIYFVGMTDEVQEVIKLLGVDQVLTSFKDVQGALWSLAELSEARTRK